MGQKAARLGFTCAIDISDGLLQDLGHVCKASSLAARIRGADIPVSDEVRRSGPENALRLALTGGEDYQLLLIGPSERMDDLGAAGLSFVIIGQMVEGKPAVSFGSGRPRGIDIGLSGWDHLRQ